MLDRYLALEGVMLAFDQDGEEWMADQLRDAMDRLWEKHLSPEDREFLNNRPSPST